MFIVSSSYSRLDQRRPTALLAAGVPAHFHLAPRAHLQLPVSSASPDYTDDVALTYFDAKRLCDARLSGASFENVLTLAHLQLFLHPAELKRLRREAASVAEPLADYQFGEFADRFFEQFLGAKTVCTLDYSAYEGASIVHDMNEPVPENLHGRFDAVIEAGSLEHIFNFPVAIRNLMLMAKVGGRVFLTTVANNLCGHGFYQFSPELIYRIFQPENGFERPGVVFLEGAFPWFELTPIQAAYQVADPEQVGARVALQCSTPIMMMVDAKKISDVPPFRAVPQQSDYVGAWQTDSTSREVARAQKPAKRLHQRVFAWLPASWQRRIQGERAKRQSSLHNTRFYRKLR
jgi:hypothetical protein